MADETLFERIISGEILRMALPRVKDGMLSRHQPKKTRSYSVVPHKGLTLSQTFSKPGGCLIQGVQEVKKLGIVFKTTDFSVVLHDGRLAGQEVPHVHFHVIPRNADDGGKSMMAMW